jgi:hypothetical protein
MELDLVRRDAGLVVEKSKKATPTICAFVHTFTAAPAFAIWFRRYAVASLLEVAFGASAIIVVPAASSSTRWKSPSSSLSTFVTSA